MIVFRAPVAPCAKPRPRFSSRGRHAYMPEAYRTWQRSFRAFMPRRRIEGAVALSITFATKSGRMRPDLDNAAGAVMDALQPDVIGNDRDVIELRARVVKSATPGIEVALRPCEVGAALVDEMAVWAA
jgi:Holliday junction resolvase RusA-like endonuclease